MTALGRQGRLTYSGGIMTKQLSAGQQALELVVQTRELLADHIHRVDVLTQQWWAQDDILQEVYAQAIAARLLVHELDANDGRQPRQFEPLPSYPVIQDERETTAEANFPDNHVDRGYAGEKS